MTADREAELRAENEKLLADNAQLQHDLGVAQADAIDNAQLAQRTAAERDAAYEQGKEVGRLMNAARLDRLQRQVDAVRAVHRLCASPIDGGDRECGECCDPWPCDTIAALDAVQPETEQR